MFILLNEHCLKQEVSKFQVIKQNVKRGYLGTEYSLPMNNQCNNKKKKHASMKRFKHTEYA